MSVNVSTLRGMCTRTGDGFPSWIEVIALLGLASLGLVVMAQRAFRTVRTGKVFYLEDYVA